MTMNKVMKIIKVEKRQELYKVAINILGDSDNEVIVLAESIERTENIRKIQVKNLMGDKLDINDEDRENILAFVSNNILAYEELNSEVDVWRTYNLLKNR